MTTLLSISALLFTVMLMQMGTGALGPLDTLSAIELGFSKIQIGISLSDAFRSAMFLSRFFYRMLKI